jgi:hypothetical protein
VRLAATRSEGRARGSLLGVSVLVAAQAVTTSMHRTEIEDDVTTLVRLGNGAPGTISATPASYQARPIESRSSARRAPLP